MAKMQDVAKIANVSTATVSRALRNPEKVRPETRDKIFQAIKELDYQPNMLARNFRTLKTKTVLVGVSNIMNPVFSKIVAGIEDEASNQGYQVLVANTRMNHDNANALFNNLKQKLVDGIILLTLRLDVKMLLEISKNHPVVLASDYLIDEDISTVLVNNYDNSREVVNYLISLGHKQIAHISGPTDLHLGKDRLRGYIDALGESAIPIRPSWIKQGEYTIQSGFELMNEILEQGETPTAVFAGNDEIAIGAIKAIRSKKLDVPSDISVVGFDDIDFSSVFEPALTTMSQPFFQMGKMAMAVLSRKIDGNSTMNEKIVLNSKLVIRESSGLEIARSVDLEE